MFDTNPNSNKVLEEVKEMPDSRQRGKNEPSDTELVTVYREATLRFGKRSEEASYAFEPIFRRYWSQIYGLALSRLGVVYAEDLAGETMQTLLERLNGNEVITNLRGLVRHSFEREYATLLEKLFQGKKLLRARQSAGIASDDEEAGRVKGAIMVSLNAPVAGSEAEEVELVQTLDDPSADVVEAAARRELVRVLHQLIGEMPSQYRAPLVCQWLMGMRIKEVAEELNLTPDQVKHNTARGIKWLQKRIPGGPDDWLL
ncbi:MAG: sigma-70 family RNA polymerase sigma factor [Chloroflexota bacterium]|nr:sigma-70 family RNA polymerase sigma factor [Chloroflexota bacterium]